MQKPKNKNDFDIPRTPLYKRQWFQITVIIIFLITIGLIHLWNAGSKALDAYFSIALSCRYIAFIDDNPCEDQTSAVMDALVHQKDALIESCPDLSEDLYQEAIDDPEHVIDCARQIEVIETP